MDPARVQFGASYLLDHSPDKVKHAPEQNKRGGSGGERPPDIIPGTYKKKRRPKMGSSRPKMGP